MKRFGEIFDRVATAGAVLGGLLVVVMMFSVTAEVAYRKLFNRSIPWVIDLAEASLLVMCFLGLAWILREGKHIRIDAFTRYLGPRAQVRIDMVTSIIGFIVMVLITVLGAGAAWQDITSGRLVVKGVIYPRWWVSMAVPVGSFLMAVGLARVTWQRWTELRERQTVEVGSERGQRHSA